MATYNYKPGLGQVGAYQVSGKPYVSGGINAVLATKIQFPSVTSWVVVSNVGGNANCRVGFSQIGVSGSGNSGLTGSYYTLKTDEQTPRLEVKLTELWLSGSNSVSVLAGLTQIQNIAIDNTAVSPSGSNWSGSTGV